MSFPRLDLTGVKGVGRRKLDGVPDAFRLAFDPRSGADDRERARAYSVVSAAVSGEEGAFTTAGARVLEAALTLLLDASPAVARADLLAEMALDLSYGDLPVVLGPILPASLRSAAAKAVRAVVTSRLDALRTGLSAPLPEARGLSAWLLLSAGASAEATVAALREERDPGVRTALLGAMAGHVTVDRAVLRAAMSPPAPPTEQAAAAAAWWALDGDEAPRDVPLSLFLARRQSRPSSGFPWRVSAGGLGLRGVLAKPSRSRSLVCGWWLDELEELLDRPQSDRLVTARAYAELSQLLGALLPQPLPQAEELGAMERRAVQVTTLRWFLGRRDFASLGLPDTVAGRLEWLGLSTPSVDASDPATVVARWVAVVEGTALGPGPSEEEARAALLRCPPLQRTTWALAYLGGRRTWPRATRAPNGPATLLALEQLTPSELDACWRNDHEPMLAALSVEGPRPIALLGRVPLPRRPHVWRAWVAIEPNADVAFREGLRFAPACPTGDVALGLLALAALVHDEDDLAALPEVLDRMGDAGAMARGRLATLNALGSKSRR